MSLLPKSSKQALPNPPRVVGADENACHTLVEYRRCCTRGLAHRPGITLVYQNSALLNASPTCVLPSPGSSLSLHQNNVLEKTYVYREDVSYPGDILHDRAIGKVCDVFFWFFSILILMSDTSRT